MISNNEYVLHVGPSYNGSRGGGIETVLRIYSENLQPFNFLASYDYGTRLHKIKFTLAFFVKFLKTLFVNRKIRVVHIHAASDVSFVRKSIVVLLARMFGKKTILHMHGGEFHLFYGKSGIFKAYHRFIIRVNELIICLSPQWIEFYSQFVPRERLRLLNNPVTSVTTVVPEHAGPRRVFLFLGLLVERKGVYDLLQSVASLTDAEKSRFLLEIGGDGEKEKMEQRVRELAIQDCVRFRGWVNGDLKTKLFEEADVYILPSHIEGLPVSVLEAMAYSLPVISTAVGGIPEIVKEGINGYLITPRDTVKLTEHIRKLIVDKELARSMGRESLKLVGPYLDKAVFPVLEAIYSEIMGEYKVVV